MPATNTVVRLLDGNRNNCNNFHSEVKTDEFGRFRLKGFETYEYKIDAYTERKQGQKQIYAKPFAVPKDGKVGEIQMLLDQSF